MIFPRRPHQQPHFPSGLLSPSFKRVFSCLHRLPAPQPGMKPPSRDLTADQLRERERNGLTQPLYLRRASSVGRQAAFQQVKAGGEPRSLRTPRSAPQQAERGGTGAGPFPSLLSLPWHSRLEKQSPARLAAAGSPPLPAPPN